LKEKNKFLESEIRDLKYEIEKDKDEIISSTKESNKENKLYLGILKMILTDNEIKKIIDFSSWKEENEEWKIHPFSLNHKETNGPLNFPSLKGFQINDFLKNEFENRDLVFDGDEKQSYKGALNGKAFKKGTFKDVLNDTKSGFNKNVISQVSNNNYKNNARYEEINNNYLNNYNNVNNSNAVEKVKSYGKNILLDPINSKKMQKIENNNIIIINKLEQKKFEDILKNTPKNIFNELSNSIKKQGKILLDPINPDLSNTKKDFYNNKKMEVSFKATFKISGENSNSPQKQRNANVNKKLAKLEKIPEIKDRDYEF